MEKKMKILVNKIKDGINIDIYGIYEREETKHLLVESILITIFSGLVVEYLKGLLNPKMAGEKRYQQLSELLKKIKNEEYPQQEVIDNQLSRSLVELCDTSIQSHEQAIRNFKSDLILAGVPDDTARIIAVVIGKNLEKFRLEE